MGQEFDDLLLQSFTDQHLSRKEKQLLQDLLAEDQPDELKLADYRQRAFAAARAALTSPEAQKVLDWLEEVVKVLHRSRAPSPAPAVAEAYFSPGDDCPGRIAQLIALARRKLDICVFTITDNRISRPIFEAHRRGVAVRIVTDNEKLHEAGSDIAEFGRAGIPVKVDDTAYHMHHKFALFDDALLLTGSYNWTRGAAEYNEENFLVTDEPRLLRKYAQVFEGLWQSLKPLR